MLWLFITTVVFAVLAALLSMVPGQNAEVAELGICSAADAPLLDSPIMTNGFSIYVCGTVAGTTGMYVSLQLLRGGEFVESWQRNLALGAFAVRLTEDQVLEPGNYVVHVVSGKQVVGQTSFAVVD